MAHLLDINISPHSIFLCYPFFILHHISPISNFFNHTVLWVPQILPRTKKGEKVNLYTYDCNYRMLNLESFKQ